VGGQGPGRGEYLEHWGSVKKMVSRKSLRKKGLIRGKWEGGGIVGGGKEIKTRGKREFHKGGLTGNRRKQEKKKRTRGEMSSREKRREVTEGGGHRRAYHLCGSI